MSKDWMVLLQEQNQLTKVVKTNETTEQFGLSLTEQDAKLILEERKNSLMEQKRIEFGEGILAEFDLEKADYSYIQEMFTQIALEDIKKHLEAALEIFIKNYYENDRELLNYLSNAISGISIRLKNAADHKVLDRMI